ncbi:MAG TPA: cyclic nucleotide-binding domain-containing protein [Aggregatilineales bacterium]|nr:cyclic nucleotide-binding domain-containing protein [Anaerolineales bacterium]HRE48153.1 cyclic nucleotide-binding domain-containing protein [Aggregatilineales bacterium]
MSIGTLLKRADIFYEMTPTQIELIAGVCEERRYSQGEVIFKEQTPGKELYVIVDGEVEIDIDPALVGKAGMGEPYKVATLRRGQSFGEISLVDEGVRSAGARAAAHDTRLIVVPRDKLMLLCETYPQLGYRLMRNLAIDLAMKIRNTDLRIREQLYWNRLETGKGEAS